ncbi:hypothetical protein QR680_011657 [Steinernema hermaphroditum]|uniref:7TM GPCR serpentine receptor class x (Srx) domain-containing protein n=1 Tax=Steinernema hermaphroditum TaxID=289476 RepID=A0AA39I1R2_9BILA|nr:hypothetical protein QR680_011657 [Steinernema hermaphroditum]
MYIGSAFYFYIAVLCTSLLTITLNGMILIKKMSTREPKGNTQIQIQYICILFYWIFAITMFVHSGYMAYALRDSDPSMDLIFWSGIMVTSVDHVVGVGNIFIAGDRFLAMQSPINYRTTYSKIVKRVYVFVVSGVVIGAIVIFWLTRVTLAKPDIVMTHQLNLKILIILSLFNSAACVCNEVLTVAFLICYWRFLRRQRSITEEHFNNIKKANQIVIYQMALEAILIVVPIVITTIFQYGFGINITDIIGSYTLLTYSSYTAACSIMFTVRLNRASENQSAGPVAVKKGNWTK